MYVESYQWQIGLERILILPLAPCGFDTPYLSLPPLGIATMIPCTWGLSGFFLEKKFLSKEVSGRKVELDEVIVPSPELEGSSSQKSVPVMPTPISEDSRCLTAHGGTYIDTG